MKYTKIDSIFFINNRFALIKKMRANSIAILHSNDEMPRNGDLTFPFRQNSDFFYLTGINQEKSILILIPSEADVKKRSVLFILKSDKHTETWQGHKLTRSEAATISGIDEVHYIDEFDKYLDIKIESCSTIYYNRNENTRYSSDVPYRDIRMQTEIKNKYPNFIFESIAPLLSALRIIKSNIEVALIKEACNITQKAFLQAIKVVKPGTWEYEVEAEIASAFIRNRANGSSFESIIASGKNACVLHYGSNNSQCKEGDLLMMDFGAEYANYAGDCSRTVPINGRFTKRQRALYDATLRVMKHAMLLIVSGTTINEYHKKVCRLWEEEHIGLGLYSAAEVAKQAPEHPLYQRYYMHGTSHYIGIDVHDVGSKDQILEPGMVVSLEPGIYIKEEGIGIRLENVILIGEIGAINLMENIPIEAEEIEILMR